MLRQVKLYSFLIALTLFSWGLVQFTTPKKIQYREALSHIPVYFSEGYNKLEMDEKGERKNSLIAEKLIHYKDDKVTELINPRMTTFNADASEWRIEADSGILSSDGKNLLLNGNVLINRDKVPGVRQVTVKTTNLRVKPAQNYAETDDWVEIIMPPDRTEGVGMQLYFAKPIHLKLLSFVKGRYEIH